MKKLIFIVIVVVVLNCGGETPPPQPSPTPIPTSSPGQTPVPPPSSTPVPNICEKFGAFLTCAKNTLLYPDPNKSGETLSILPTAPPTNLADCNTLAQQYKARFPSCEAHLK